MVLYCVGTEDVFHVKKIPLASLRSGWMETVCPGAGKEVHVLESMVENV